MIVSLIPWIMSLREARLAGRVMRWEVQELLTTDGEEWADEWPSSDDAPEAP